MKKYTIEQEKELVEILNKHTFNFTFKILNRDEDLFLPIEFSVKHSYRFYPGLFSFYSELFEENLFKDFFSYNATILEAIDKSNFIIHFAFQHPQEIY